MAKILGREDLEQSSVFQENTVAQGQTMFLP